MDKSELIHYCKQQGLVTGSAIKVTPLAGGVSSDIVLVECGEQRFVLKQSLAKLKVADAWYCDTDRNISETQAIQYAAQLFPQSVPQLLHVDAENKLFSMEYLGEGYVPWKEQLLEGQVDCEIAKQLASLLAILHESTWENAAVKQTFDTTKNFYALRIEPYLITTGQRHPELNEILSGEAERLANCRLALVHGDWSAKNVLVSADRLVMLDWEVVWFGDPAFDSAFLLNLLYLKSLYRRHQAAEYLELIETFRNVYRARMRHYDEALESRICRLTQMLMLGRIDGKSPAEYLVDQEDKNLVRQLISKSLLNQVDDFSTFDTLWRKAVAER